MTSSQDPGDRGSPFAMWVMFGAAIVLTGISAAVWPGSSEGTGLAETSSRFDTPHQRPSPEFVTSDTCRSCHPDQYSTWHDSYHRTMSQLATPEAVVAPFDDVELTDGALTCRLERRGDEFWATVFETNWKERYRAAGISPDSVIGTARSPFLTTRIEMTTGSHHMQVYWVSNGGRMMELPFYYHIDGQRWIPRDDSVLAPPRAPDAGISTSEWRLDCIKCHSLGGKPKLSSDRRHLESSVAEFGISCEACHGPAKEHIQHHRNPLNRYRQYFDDDGDPTIVNPARLSHKASTQICGQCHISFDPRNNDDFLSNGLRYRAGDDLDVTHDVQKFDPDEKASGGYTTFWQDGTCCVGGDEYLGIIRSGCYQNGKMSCLSCHSMHSSDPSDQLAERMDGDHACLQCHKTYADDIEAHTHHAIGSSGSQCYNCHMPHTTYALFTAMRSHRVDSPNIQSSVDSGRPNACNLCHQNQTLQWSADRLTEWYGAPPVELTEEEQTIAASVLWVLRGNAVQRLITAWHMGWKPAQDASGQSWQALFLAQLMEDPYAMVRFVAHDALRRLPGFEDYKFDYTEAPDKRARAHQEIRSQWSSQQHTLESAALLGDKNGAPRQDEIDRLLKQRDDTPIVITE
jgi:predicted CXXCH cytochrome family protein